MPTTRRKEWLGGTTCDLCGKDCGKELIDGATQMGPWAVMCLSCHALRGVGLGTGRGQLYHRVRDHYFKVQG